MSVIGILYGCKKAILVTMNTIFTKMECFPLSKNKPLLDWWLLMVMIAILILFQPSHGGCIEEEKRALLDIKFSLINAYASKADLLHTWIDYNGSECCDWERVKCNKTSGHVTEISLFSLTDLFDPLWSLNVSLFLHFEELTNLNLSQNNLDSGIMKTDLEKLSSLKKLRTLDLSLNYGLDIDIIHSLSALTSLVNLDLSKNSMGLGGYFPANEFAALENLEMLDLTECGLYGFERISKLRKLEILNLGVNEFNDTIIASLSVFPSLKDIDLSFNKLSGPFPAQELAQLTNVEKLDLSFNTLNGTQNIQACKSLWRLERLENIALSNNNFNNSIFSCLSALPSLKILDLSYSASLGSSFPIQEFLNWPDLEILLLRHNGFNGTLPMQAFTYFQRLEVLDLSENGFVGRIPSTIHALSSLRAVSFAKNKLNGSLSDHGFCELKNLKELDLSRNMFDGILPQCFNNLSSLKYFDISSNLFTGRIHPSLVASLTSLEYIDFSHNKFEGPFSFNSFSNHTKLEVVQFKSDNDKFEVETEEPVDWIPKFQLEVLVLSNCNINRAKGHVVPGFLLHQHKLGVVDMSHNSLVGQFPSWLIENNRNLESLNLANNSFGGNFRMPLYRNDYMKGLDMSGNHMIGTIPNDIQNFFPNITYLNLSRNVLSGALPSSICDMSFLEVLDLSDNGFSGEVPKGLFANLSPLVMLKLSNNQFHGDVLSGNLSFGVIKAVHLDSNHFTGNIGNNTDENLQLLTLDISNNFFTGIIPDWISNISLSELVMRNNSFEGRFPCGAAPFSFLDISHNAFSGPIPSCLNLQHMKHLHLRSNRFTGSIPTFFRNLTKLLTLDIGNNSLSGRIPNFLGELSNLRILLLTKNNFRGSIPRQLCQLSNVSLIDLSYNYLSGSIPSCLQNITGPSDLAFVKHRISSLFMYFYYEHSSILPRSQLITTNNDAFQIRDEVQFITKSLSLPYKGDILDYMAGLDLSCNMLTGEIPEELGFLTHIHALNLSHNQLTGPIPVNFSNLAKIESLDLSSNRLTGKVPSQLIKLTFLSVFNVSHNNLSGRLPEMKAQFGTFTEESYGGNPLLCGLPLKNKCTNNPQVNDPLAEKDTEKWYDIDMSYFNGSWSSTYVLILLGFAALLYTNPHWRRRWLDWVEDSMFTCYYFLCDLVSKLSMAFHI